MVSFDSIKGMVKYLQFTFSILYFETNHTAILYIYIYLTFKKHGYKNVTLS